MIRSMAAASAAAALAFGTSAAAGPPSQQIQQCPGPLDAATVVRCALAGSPEVQQARAELASVAGRRRAAGVWLPSHPVVAATVSRRRAEGPGGGTVLNWSAVLSQELELAGQRGARVDAAGAEAAAQVRRLAVAEQDVAARALHAYYEALAAREALGLARELAESGAGLAAAAEGRAREALLSGVDADVVRAESVRLGLMRFEAERRWAVARAAVAILTGAPQDAEVTGALGAPAGDEARSDAHLESEALRLRGEIAAAEMERQVLDRQMAVLRRQRVPNVTLSAFAERDGYADRVLGIGLSVPLPLPGPLGPSRAGEIEAARGQLDAAAGALEQVRRRVRLEVAQAAAGLRARQGALALFGDPLMTRARKDLAAIREGIAARQLTIREALAAQRSLIELLQAGIEARLAHATAWVELRRVVGAPLLGGSR